MFPLFYVFQRILQPIFCYVITHTTFNVFSQIWEIMLNEQLLKSLSIFGLESIDALVYASLLQCGSSSVGALAEKLDVERGKAYRAINKLRNIGIIKTTFSNPTMCSAIDPSNALKIIIQQKKEECVTMEKFSNEVINELKDICRSGDSTANNLSSFTIIQGRANIYTRIGKVIEDATDIVYLVTTIDDLIMMYHTSIPEKIKLCQKNGGEVRIITEINNDEQTVFIDRLGVNNVRIGKLTSKSRMVVENNKQLIMSNVILESKNLNDNSDTVISTNCTEMASNIYSLCSIIWKKSKTLDLRASRKIPNF